MAFGSNPPPVQPHICVLRGVEAIAFYEAAFGARCTFVQMAEDGVRVLHANLAICGGEVMLHDEFADCGDAMRAPATLDGASVAININLPDPDAVDAACARAALAGATVIIPPADMFWGARHARVRDPFGHVWAFNAALDPH